MSLYIIEQEVLNNLNLKSIRLYAEIKGWKKENIEHGEDEKWSKENTYIRLPISSESKLYFENLQECLQKFSEIEGRSFLDIIKDIQYVSADRIEFCFESNHLVDLPQILANVKALFTSLSCTGVETNIQERNKLDSDINNIQVGFIDKLNSCLFLSCIIPVFSLDDLDKNQEKKKITIDEESSKERKIILSIHNNFSALKENTNKKKFFISLIRLFINNKRNGFEILLKPSPLIPSKLLKDTFSMKIDDKFILNVLDQL